MTRDKSMHVVRSGIYAIFLKDAGCEGKGRQRLSPARNALLLPGCPHDDEEEHVTAFFHPAPQTLQRGRQSFAPRAAVHGGCVDARCAARI